jgi:hypothetical protein
MAEKKSKIILEDRDNNKHRLVMEGSIDGCANLIAQNYVGDSYFREAVNRAMRCIMEMGVELLEQQQAKDMGDED